MDGEINSTGKAGEDLKNQEIILVSTPPKKCYLPGELSNKYERAFKTN